LLAFADDHDGSLLAYRRVGDNARQVAHFLDLMAVEPDDHVARLDTRRLGRTFIVDTGDERAARRPDIEAFGNLVGHLLDAHAQPTTPCLPELLELVDDI